MLKKYKPEENADKCLPFIQYVLKNILYAFCNLDMYRKKAIIKFHSTAFLKKPDQIFFFKKFGEMATAMASHFLLPPFPFLFPLIFRLEFSVATGKKIVKFRGKKYTKNAFYLFGASLACKTL